MTKEQSGLACATLGKRNTGLCFFCFSVFCRRSTGSLGGRHQENIHARCDCELCPTKSWCLSKSCLSIFNCVAEKHHMFLFPIWTKRFFWWSSSADSLFPLVLQATLIQGSPRSRVRCAFARQRVLELGIQLDDPAKQATRRR